MKKVKPLIGIVGGAGPLAAIDVQKKLFNVMNMELGATKDQDYFSVYTDNNPDFLDRSKAILNSNNLVIDQYVKKIKNLEKLNVNIVLISCNTAHAFINEIRAQVNVLVIDAIAETASYISSKYDVKKVGLLATLGTFKSNIYKTNFKKYNINIQPLPLSKRQKVHKAIYGIKANIINSNSTQDFNKLDEIYNSLNLPQQEDNNVIESPVDLIKDALEYLKGQKVLHIILGCTELPLAINDQLYKNIQLHDPMLIASRKIVHYCKLLYK